MNESLYSLEPKSRKFSKVIVGAGKRSKNRVKLRFGALAIGWIMPLTEVKIGGGWNKKSSL